MGAFFYWHKKLSAQLQVGMKLEAVGDINVTDMEFPTVIDTIKTSPRPLRLLFVVSSEHARSLALESPREGTVSFVFSPEQAKGHKADQANQPAQDPERTEEKVDEELGEDDESGAEVDIEGEAIEHHRAAEEESNATIEA